MTLSWEHLQNHSWSIPHDLDEAIDAFGAKPLSIQRGIFFIRNWLQPFVGGVLAWHFNSEVGKPAVLRCTVPMLDTSRDFDHIASFQGLCRLACFLIPALAGGAQKDLPAALIGLMNVPVVAAARFKGYIADEHPFLGQDIQIALTHEILHVGSVFRPAFKDTIFVFLLVIFLFSIEA